MINNYNLYNRQSIRLKEYDYSQSGAYFITICTKNRECLFGAIKNGEMTLNKLGKIAYNELKKTSEIRKNMEINCFVVMPNHIHAIVTINNSVGAYCNTPQLVSQNDFNTSQKTKFQSPSNNLG